jgi:hypothetical protein
VLPLGIGEYMKTFLMLALLSFSFQSFAWDDFSANESASFETQTSPYLQNDEDSSSTESISSANLSSNLSNTLIDDEGDSMEIN